MAEITEKEAGEKHVPLEGKWVWWAWPLLLVFLVGVSYGSYFLRNFTDSILLYLPTPFAIILLYWYGPRMLPLIYINEIITLVLWGASGGWIRIVLLAAHAPITTFCSWYFYKKPNKEGPLEMLSSTKSFLRFTVFGVLLPVLVNSIFTYQYTFVGGDLYTVALILLADFLTIITIATPILYFIAPDPNKFSLHAVKPLVPAAAESHDEKAVRFWTIMIIFSVMIFFVNFDTYWFVYGVVSIVVAIQRGFASVILINAVIFVLNYILPALDFADLFLASKGSTKLINVHMPMSTMIISSSLIGRVISDLWKVEYKLTHQKKELERTNDQLQKTNDELDRFVYSLSHDISAPLKSIKGLVNLSRIEKDPSQGGGYLSKIELSIIRLENFVKEVLDYSRTSRKELNAEKIRLSDFVQDIVNDLKYQENAENIQVMVAMEHEEVLLDKFLLKVAVSNLVSNAIKYQKKNEGHKPYLKVSSYALNSIVKIRIEDNGEGIAAEYQEKVFEMFYRGSDTSTGSGLGLYITKEAVDKMGGDIELESRPGEGTAFTISLPLSAKV